MAKKKKRATKRKVPTNSVSALRAERGVDVLAIAFLEWARSEIGMSAEEAMGSLDSVKPFVAAYFGLSPAFEVTAFNPEIFEEALNTSCDPLQEDDSINFHVESVHLYLDFLHETARWTGSAADFEEIHATFHGGSSQIPALDLPEIGQADELAELNGLALIQLTKNLLAWVGDGKEITATGALRLKDIEGAAGSVGLKAKGGRKSRSQDGFTMVNTMFDLPLLSDLWALLEAVDLVSVNSTRARPTSRAAIFLGADSPERLDVLRDIVEQYLFLHIHGDREAHPIINVVNSALAVALYAGSGAAEPITLEELTSGSLMNEPSIDRLVNELLKGRMENLESLGLVSLRPTISVPRSVAPATSAVMEYSLQLDGSDFGPSMGAPVLSETIPAPSAATRFYQIKVSLKDSNPPVWRRLQVRSDFTLEHLHHIIQAAFAWQNSHLHEFRVGGHGGVAYGPVGLGNDFGFHEQGDESGITIADLLSKERESLDYTYDFGDMWEHVVTLEKILPFDSGKPAALCMAGRNAAPYEDSGGVHGWTEKLGIAVDPSHAEHKFIRDWLLLEPGEDLDPTEFDLAQTNADLEFLF